MVAPGMNPFQREKEIIDYKLEHAKEDILAYKRQVFRHYVGSQTWDNYYDLNSSKRAMATMDFGMKWLPEKHRETSIEYFAKVSIFPKKNRYGAYQKHICASSLVSRFTKIGHK